MASVTVTRVERRGDRLTIVGTVDDVPARAECWKSHVDTLGTNAAKLSYAAGLLKTAADEATPATVALTGTVTV
jgi:hypothetical protein